MRSYHPLRFLLPVPPFTRSLAAVESRIVILRDSAETLVCRSLAFAACLLRGRRQVGLFHKDCVFGHDYDCNFFGICLEILNEPLRTILSGTAQLARRPTVRRQSSKLLAQESGVRQKSDRPTVDREMTKFLQTDGFTIIQSSVRGETCSNLRFVEESHRVFVTRTIALLERLPTLSRNKKC